MDSDSQLDSLFSQLEQLAPDSRVADELSQLLDELEPLIESHGLTENQIARGYELALGGHLDTSLSLALLPLLLPRVPISSRPVLRIISTLGLSWDQKPAHHGRVKLTVQKKALEGLCVLLEVGAVGKEGRETLDQFWGVLERGLEYGMLRDATASLLFLITRRVHVQKHRISHLDRLIKNLPTSPPSFFRLRALFRSFYPEYVISLGSKDVGTSARRSPAKEEWAAKVRAVLQDGEGESMRRGEGREAKRRKLTQAYVPSGATFAAGTTSTVLSDIPTISQLAAQIDKLDMPSQAGSVLSAVPGSGASDPTRGEEDRVKAWAAIIGCGYGGDDSDLFRLTSFINSSLEFELHDLDDTADGVLRVEDLLCRVRELSVMGGELPEGLEPFLADYLSTWDGESHRQVIFDLVALQKPLPYEVLYGHLLRPLQLLSVSADAEWLADWISCLMSLVRNWATRDDWESESERGGPRRVPSIRRDGRRLISNRRRTVFGALEPNVAYLRSLQAFVEYGDRIISAGIITFPESVTLRSAALSFYEASLSLPLEHELHVVAIPSPSVTYTCLLASESMSISRICGIIAKLREALTSQASAVSPSDPHNVELVNFLNTYLVDFVNCIWSKRLLNPQGANAMGLTPEQLEGVKEWTEGREQVLSSSLGLTTHPALSTLAQDCLVQICENEGVSFDPRGSGPVVAASLKDLTSTGLKISFTDFRVLFLEYLREKGAVGIHEFLFTSLQSLITRKALLPQSPAGSPA